MNHTRTITLTDDGEQFAVVDASDYEWLSEYKWCLYKYRGCLYARRTGTVRGKETSIYMHREIAKKNLSGRTRARNLVDHRNGNGLDNRTENLRWATARENRLNHNGCAWRHMTDLP